MKTKVVVLLAFMLLPILGMGQSRQDIETRKREFITTKLHLTPEEAEKFWPLYNELQDKKKALKKERKALRPDQPVNELTDAEVEEKLDKHFEIKQRELNLEKEYTNKFKTAIPVKKVARLAIVEEMFKKELLRRLQQQKQNNQRRGGGAGRRF